VAPERDDCRFFGFGQNRRALFRRPGFKVLNRRALAPFRRRLGVDAKLPAQLRERSLRSFGPSLEPMAGWPSLLLL
jgi:hypothetical protein